MTAKEKIKLLKNQIKLLEKVNEITNKLIVELQRVAFPVYPTYPQFPPVPNPYPNPWVIPVSPDYYRTGDPLPAWPIITCEGK